MYINIQEDYGRAYGFNCELFDTRFNNFIEKYQINTSEELRSLIKATLNENITLLNHIEIKSSEKNKGLGTKLLNNFINQANSCILLVSDVNEANNFNLTSWYQKNGFSILTETKYGPLMFKIS